jgi:hypothetical protein
MLHQAGITGRLEALVAVRPLVGLIACLGGLVYYALLRARRLSQAIQFCAQPISEPNTPLYMIVYTPSNCVEEGSNASYVIRQTLNPSQIFVPS